MKFKIKPNLTMKLYYCCVLTCLILIAYPCLKDFVNNRREMNDTKGISKMTKQEIDVNKLNMKYILQWTSPSTIPFQNMGEGQSGFIERKCPHVNCFVTANRSYFSSYTKFHAIVFAGPEVIPMGVAFLPKKRLPNQKFVYANIESSDNYPICSDVFDGYFNWTWTYKLDSEVRWGYIVIRNSQNEIIGPNKDMHWMKLNEMDPVSNQFKESLKTKTKAAAWFVSNCNTVSGREDFAKKLQMELYQYDLIIDIFGSCGSFTCSRNLEDECNKKIEKSYYFYLSFENAFGEDYVTEKLWRPLKYNAVPIVFGAANYTRFMPDGIYLNAIELGVERLAVKMYQLIKDPDQYAEYFKWKNHYTYHRTTESVETNEYCRFCSILNDNNKMKEITTYRKLKEWWDPPNAC